MTVARETPTVVTASFWLWIVSVALSAVGVVIGLVAGTAPTADVGGDAEVARAVAPIAGLVGLIVGGGLRVLFALFLLRGRNWARIVLLIIAIITALGSIASILTGSVFNILAIVATIIAAVLMYLPAANAYFRAAGAPATN